MGEEDCTAPVLVGIGDPKTLPLVFLDDRDEDSNLPICLRV